MANIATHRTGEAARAGDHAQLTAAEIAALALSLAHLGAGPQAATARRALRSLLDAEPHGDTVTATLATLTEPLDASTADRARVVAAAITEHRVVRLCYGDAGANVTIREVEPVTCLVHRDHWYLVGWCRMRRGVRAFRFDRILAVESTGLPARPRRADRYLPFQRRTPAAA
ncbi:MULTISPECIES: helix-turn-helix transcriptional regulator [Actinomadura]|uniref:Helix-turn-helix transcriptional regulator n=1 Tax=Actinomadura yumaensis TaxID=111807 RepID=A0ABW2D0M1_9ACTN|nr:WYL domain-containing protein [Actinomadura sp. J1-007]MWK33316.1 WYL domain-containing protein [Actinomadura sp. J1-007]